MVNGCVFGGMIHHIHCIRVFIQDRFDHDVTTNGGDQLERSLDEAEQFEDSIEDELPPQDLTKSLLAKFRSLEDVSQPPPSPLHSAQQKKV